jgi:hypothetical protein
MKEAWQWFIRFASNDRRLSSLMTRVVFIVGILLVLLPAIITIASMAYEIRCSALLNGCETGRRQKP